MTPEKVTELAQKAGIYVGKTIISLSPFDLQRFAQLVRNESLEDAAKMCDALATPERPQLAQHEAIRVMREALETLSLLGNGPHPGNSIGNLIAQKALKDTENI